MKEKPPKISEKTSTTIRARAIPITSSNTNSFGSSDLNKDSDLLYIVGAKNSITNPKNNNGPDGSLAKITVNKTTKEVHVPPPGNLPNPKRVAS